MTKLCPRGKAAAKRKFKVYPSAYANAYASKICAGKIKDPSGVKRKDFRGPKPSGAKVGMAVTAGAQSATGRLEKPKKFMIVDEEGNPKKIKQPKRKPFYPHESTGELKKMMSGGFGIFGKKKKEEEKKSVQEENANKKKKRLEELRKEIGAKKGKMMIMIAVGKPKKANKGAIMNVANKLEKASKAHAGQAKTLKSLKLTRGGEMDYSKQKKDKMKTKPYGIEDRKIKTERLISQKDLAILKKEKGIGLNPSPKNTSPGKTISPKYSVTPAKYSVGGGADMSTIKKKKKKPAPGGRKERHEYMKNIQNPISEYDEKGKLKYTAAKVGMNVTAGGQSAMGRLEKSGMRGGGIAIKGTKFKGVF